MAGVNGVNNNIPPAPDPAANLSPELQRIYRQADQMERRPIAIVEQRRDNVQERLKLINDAIGRVEEARKIVPGLNTAFAIKELTVHSGNEKVITGTADKSQADFGKYSLEVLQLAKSPHALSNRFSDKDSTKIGTGYISWETASGETREIFIDNDNATLEGIAKLINESDAEVRATVITDMADPDAPYRLMMSGKDTGNVNDLKYPELYFVDGEEDFYVDIENPAQNARVLFEGQEIEASGNQLKDLIRGVSLDLKGLGEPGKPIGISVEQDIPKTIDKIKSLVNNVNKVFELVQEQNKLDDKSQTQKTLGGDYGLRMAENRLREALQGTNRLFAEDDIPRQIRTLSDIGIEFNKKGILNLNEKKLENALNANYRQTVDLLAGDQFNVGVVPKLGQVLNSMVTPGSGLLVNQRGTFTNQINRYSQEIQQKDERAQRKAEHMRLKLAQMQGALSSMQSQQGTIAALGAQEGAMVSQLLGSVR